MFCWEPDTSPIMSLELLGELAWLRDDSDARSPTRDWWQAFNVDRVSAAFLADASSVLAEMERELSPVNTLSEDRLRWFVLSMFSGLVFLRMVERKGWFAVDGESNSLRETWWQSHDRGGNLFTTWLGPLLFFRQWRWKTDCRLTPELAVLFRAGWHPDQTVFSTQPHVPDSVLRSLMGSDGLLYRYEFTVDELLARDGQIAVGPQMLGQVFEEEMAGRRAAGAYYTPPAVVSFMCRESLKGVLFEKTSIDQKRIDAVVDASDACTLDATSAIELSESIETLRVVDPACGSGAYLLGFLHEVCRIQCVLSPAAGITNSRLIRQWKRQIVSRNLFGVDLNPVATRIASLRLWLALAVDAEELSDLSELSIRIETGDALLGPVPQRDDTRVQQQMQPSIPTDTAVTVMDVSQNEHASGRGSRKPSAELVNAGGHDWYGTGVVRSIDWGECFPDVFGSGEFGFDIVLANPPYVRNQRIPKSIRSVLRTQYANAITGHSDLYCCFYVRALQILRCHGMHVFLCSNSWLDSRYGGKLQRYLLERSQIQALYESANCREFAAADINTVVSVIRKRVAGPTDLTRFVLLREGFGAADKTQRRETCVTRDRLWQAGQRSGRQTGDYVQNKWGGKYLRAPEIYLRILEQARSMLTPLAAVAEIMGYIHDNNTGAGFPERPFLKSVKCATQIRILPDSTGVQLYGVKPAGRSARIAPILFPRTFGARHLVVWNPQGVFGKEFYKITPAHPRDVLSLIVQLNSTWGMLQRELLGLTNLGDGALKFSVYDLVLFDIVRDLDVGACSQAWDHLSQRVQTHPEQELWQSDRMDVDRVVFDALGLSASQSEQVRVAVCELVERRLAKSRTAGVQNAKNVFASR
ncbi:MAG: DNA methyltransferase [Planctomycetaceae bacterium]